MSILRLINSAGYMSINREMAHQLGLDTAVIFADLVRQHMKCEEKGSFETFKGRDKWFYAKMDDMQKWTSLGRKKQDSALKQLKARGLITQMVCGIPPKRYFILNMQKVFEFFEIDNNSPICPKRTNTSQNEIQKENIKCPKRTNRNVPNGQISPYNIKEKKIKEDNYIPPNPPAPICPDSIEEPNAPNGASVPVSSISSSSHKHEDEVSITEEVKASFRYGPDPVRHDMVVEEKVSVKRKSKDTDEKQDPDKLSFGEDGFVKLTQREYNNLLKHMTEAEREKWIRVVNNAIGAMGEKKFRKKYTSHYHTILQWKDYRTEKNPMVDKDGRDWSKIAPHRRGSKLVTSGDFDDYAGFQGRML